MKEDLNIKLETGFIDLEKNLASRDLSIGLRASLAAGQMLRGAFYSKYESGLNPDGSQFTPFDVQAEKIAKDLIKEFEPEAVVMGEELTPNEDVSGRDFWVIDGIDGTTNFSRKIPICNFTLAKVENGQTSVAVVYEFLKDNIYFAVKGGGSYLNSRKLSVVERPFNESVITFAPLLNVRKGKGKYEGEQVESLWNSMKQISEKSKRFHREFQSGGLELSWVASGKLDGYLSSWTNPWDLSAGVLIVREAGGIVTNVFGQEWQPGYLGVVAGTKTVHPEILGIYQSEFLKAFEKIG